MGASRGGTIFLSRHANIEGFDGNYVHQEVKGVSHVEITSRVHEMSRGRNGSINSRIRDVNHPRRDRDTSRRKDRVWMEGVERGIAIIAVVIGKARGRQGRGGMRSVIQIRNRVGHRILLTVGKVMEATG